MQKLPIDVSSVILLQQIKHKFGSNFSNTMIIGLISSMTANVGTFILLNKSLQFLNHA